MKYPLKKKTSKYRSGLEESVIAQLKMCKANFVYEGCYIGYSKPATSHKYIPDIKLENGLFVEIKGWLQAKDRKKHLYIKQSNPLVEIRFVFGNANNKIYKGSKTTYADWCNKHGFKYAERKIPQEWIEEKLK